MWIRDTGEIECVHIEGISKTTLFDALIYPLRAIWSMGKNGRICNEVHGGNIASTETAIKRNHPAQKKSA